MRKRLPIEKFGLQNIKKSLYEGKEWINLAINYTQIVKVLLKRVHTIGFIPLASKCKLQTFHIQTQLVIKRSGKNRETHTNAHTDTTQEEGRWNRMIYLVWGKSKEESQKVHFHSTTKGSDPYSPSFWYMYSEISINYYNFQYL